MAQVLAKVENHAHGGILDKDLDDFVTFVVGGQMFGVPVLKVQDILILREIATIPLAPPAIMGSINLRGRIVTVINVRQRMGIERRAPATEERDTIGFGVTIEKGQDLYTLLVDKIGDVLSASHEQFESNPSTLDPIWREFALGVYRLESELMVVLDVERLLDIQA